MIPATRDLILLAIDTLTGNSFDLIMHRRALVIDLKSRIKYMTGIEQEDQHLVYGNIELKNEASLEHYRLESGSRLRLVTGMRGGPISFRRPTPLPPFLNLAAYLLAAAEVEPQDQRPDEPETENKNVVEVNSNPRDQAVAYFIVHDGVIVKVTEFDSDDAGEEAQAFFKKLSQEAVVESAKQIQQEEEIKKESENEKTREKMRNLKKNMFEANAVKEKMKLKNLSRPEPPNSLLQGSPSPTATNSIDNSTVNKTTQTHSQRPAKQKREPKSPGRSSPQKEEEPSDHVNQPQPLQKKAHPLNNAVKMKVTQRRQNDKKPTRDFVKITQMDVFEKAVVKTAQPISVAGVSSGEYIKDVEDSTGNQSLLSSFRDSPNTRSLRQTTRSDAPRNNFYVCGADSNIRPIYTTGFMGSNYERYIRESDFMRQTQSLDEGARSRRNPYSTTTDQNFRFSNQLQKLKDEQPSQRHSYHRPQAWVNNRSRHPSNVYLDGLITLMAQTIMGTSKRSFERRSSTFNNQTGLTSRRFTHDGSMTTYPNLSKRENEDERLPPLRASKMNIETKKQQTEQKPLGKVVIDRCAVCSKKLGIGTTFRCKCNSLFCALHRFPEEHECKYDHKKEGKEQIKKANPVVQGTKINKI